MVGPPQAQPLASVAPTGDEEWRKPSTARPPYGPTALPPLSPLAPHRIPSLCTSYPLRIQTVDVLYYCEDLVTKKQETLKTREKDE